MNNVQIFVSQQIQHELQQGAKQMPNTNPFQTPVSKNEFNGYWIPSHNAKVMKKGLEENSAPFLPDTSGNIKAEAVYSLSTGKCLPANRLIPVQFEKMKMGYESNIVVSKSTISEMNTEIKEGEKGILYNFKGKDDNFHTAAFFFPEQTETPEAFNELAQEKIHPLDNLKDISMTIESSEPTEYLGTYLAACRSGMKVSVSLETAQEFKDRIMVNVENDMKKSENRNKEIESVGNILFNADKRGTEILKTLAHENAPSQSPQMKQDDMEVCF